MTSPKLFAVVMAGGSGTRFWPASRRARPKQFLPISGGKAMLAETCARLAGLVPWENILVVTAESQAALVRAALPELPRANVLCEPAARNTAPCVAFAAEEVARRASDSLQIVLPADHVIHPLESFQRTLRAAVAAATREDALVIFGVRPDHPATGYGYIEAGATLAEFDGIPLYGVQRFVEKPERARAEQFLAAGTFLWNSGMFVWHTRAIRSALAAHAPALTDGFARIARGEALERVYPTLPSVAIDVAVLEKAANVRMLPIDYAWNDVGSWSALPDVHRADAQGNWRALSGGARLLVEDARGCVAYAEGNEVVALIGVQDLVVVRAGNATLVCPRARAQDVKKIVERLASEGPEFL
ncbi:MAG: sugar phosphate nucleotidyltransferase [Planctomycetota bacterium]